MMSFGAKFSTALVIKLLAVDHTTSNRFAKPESPCTFRRPNSGAAPMRPQFLVARQPETLAANRCVNGMRRGLSGKSEPLIGRSDSVAADGRVSTPPVRTLQVQGSSP